MKKQNFFSLLCLGALGLAGPKALAVECSIATQDTWDTGFVFVYNITNTSSASIDHWQVAVDLAQTATVNTNWDSSINSSAPLVISNAGWNGTLAPNASTSFGISGSKTGELTPPNCFDPVNLPPSPPEIDPAVVETTSGSYGFTWDDVEGASHYIVQKTTLDENGEPTEWENPISVSTPGFGAGRQPVGHYGFRVQACNDNGCSEFGAIKTAVVYKLQSQKVNAVTGTYEILVEAPFAVTLTENGNVIASDITKETLTFIHKPTGTFTYQLGGLNKEATVEVNRFDPSIDIDRSVFVHDEATLDATGLDLTGVFNTLAAGLNADNPSDTITGTDLFARMWDAQNPEDGETHTSVEHCTGELNGFPMECRPSEGIQAQDPATFLSNYRLISLVNRLDLRDRRTFNHCGEARAIYALTNNNPSRNFIIFEAKLPNPQPGVEAGCLPIAQFWHDLSDENNAAQRATALQSFYNNGIPAANVAPVFDINHFKEGTGQVRTNQFMKFVWVLKEYKIGLQNGLSTLFLTTVKNNPFGELFNGSTTLPDAGEFQNIFGGGAQRLIGGLSFIDLPKYDDKFNNNQSHSSDEFPRLLTQENDFNHHNSQSPDSDFEKRIELTLSQVRSDLTVEQILNRATAMTCGGCHQPSRFGLTAPDAVGPGLSWPDTLNFVHVQENPVDGAFPLSEALTEVFLPDRRDDFETYLSLGAGEQEEVFLDTPEDNGSDIDGGDRSG